MPTVFLEFEQPIADLHAEIQKLTEMQSKGTIDVQDKIDELEQKIKEKQKEIYSNLTVWQRVLVSRHTERPYSLFYADHICTDFLELHGDRNVRDDKAIVGGFANLDGESVMIIGHQKGINTKMRQYRNFGMANPEGYRKALRLMRLAEKFNKPIITFVDTPGAFPGIEAEDRGQAEAIARNIYEMIKLKVPVLVVIIGEGASGGALGIGVGDRTLMLENTWFTVISPESCSSILWRSWEHKEKAAVVLKLTPEDNLKNGIIDGIVNEPLGGAHAYPEEMAQILKVEIKKHLAELKAKSPEQRVTERIEKYSKIGFFKESAAGI
jgi:acetyl-CoA carboxylase carboxyl transferase subunit alpha